MASGKLVEKLQLDSSGFSQNINRAKGKLDELKKAGDMKRMNASFKNLSSNLDEFTNKLGFSTASLTKFTSLTGGLIAIGAGVTAIGVKSVKAAADLETLDTNLGTLLGSQEKGIALRKELQKYGEKTPYDTKGLAEAARTMLGYNVAQEKVMPLMKQFGDIAMGDKNKLNALALGFGQMNAVGKATKQDLNQLANAGFGFDIIAKSMGVSTGEFLDLVSKGKVKVSDIEKALKDATSEGGLFFNSAINSSQTFEGVMSNLGKAVNNTFANIGTELLPFVKDAANGLVDVFESLGDVIEYIVNPTDEGKEKFGEFGDVIDAVRNAVTNIWNNIKDLIDSFTELFTKTDDGSSIMRTIVDIFKDAISTISQAISVLSDYVANTIKALMANDSFKNILNGVVAVFKFVYSAISSVVKTIIWLTQEINKSGLANTWYAKTFSFLITPIVKVIGWIKTLVGWLQKAVDWYNKLLNKTISENKQVKSKKNPKQKNKPTKQTTTNNNTNTNLSDNESPTKPTGDGKAKPTGGSGKKKVETSADRIKKATDDYNKSLKEINNKSNVGFYESKLDKIKDEDEALKKLIESYATEGKSIKELQQKHIENLSIIKKENDALEEQKKSAKDLEDRQKKIKDANEQAAKARDSKNYQKTSKTEDVASGPHTKQESLDKQKSALVQQGKDIEKAIDLKTGLGLDTTDDQKALDDVIKKIYNVNDALNQIKNSDKVIEGFTSALDDFGGNSPYQSIMESIQGFKNVLTYLNDVNAQNQQLGRTLTTVESAGLAAGSGAAMLGQSLQALSDDGAAAKIGSVLAAVGNIILGFSQASIQAASMGPWGWLAFTAAGLASVATTISTLQSFSNGGLVQGPGTPSGDMNFIKVNSGEMVLNKGQQANLFKMLDSGQMNQGTTVSTVRVKGSDLYLTLQNYSKIKGKSGVSTGIR